MTFKAWVRGVDVRLAVALFLALFSASPALPGVGPDGIALMACGCPVVSNRGDNIEWLLNENNAVLADLTVQALSGAIVALLSDEDGRFTLVEQGLEFSSKTDWAVEASKLARVFEDLGQKTSRRFVL